MKKRRITNTRRKGSSFEYDTQRFMQDNHVNFKRHGMSGQLEELKADFSWIENGKIFTGESKVGGQVPLWLYTTLEKDTCSFLVVKRDRKQRLWILTDEMIELLFGK